MKLIRNVIYVAVVVLSRIIVAVFASSSTTAAAYDHDEVDNSDDHGKETPQNHSRRMTRGNGRRNYKGQGGGGGGNGQRRNLAPSNAGKGQCDAATSAGAYSCDDAAFPGTIYEVGGETCEIFTQRTVTRYDMLNGFYAANGVQYGDSCYNGVGFLDGSYDPLAFGTGTLTNGNCGNGAGTNKNDEWVGWNVVGGVLIDPAVSPPQTLGQDNYIGVTVFFEETVTVDVVTLTFRDRFGSGQTCLPSGVNVNGQYVNFVADPNITDQDAVVKIKVYLEEPFVGNVLYLEVYQDGRIVNARNCNFVFMGEMEFHTCVPMIPTFSESSSKSKSKTTSSSDDDDACVDDSITGTALEYLQYVCSLV